MSAREHIKYQDKTFAEALKQKDLKIEDVERKLNLALEREVKLGAIIDDLESKGKHLSYDDLKPGGTLAKHVNDFTFFPDYSG